MDENEALKQLKEIASTMDDSQLRVALSVIVGAALMDDLESLNQLLKMFARAAIAKATKP